MMTRKDYEIVEHTADVGLKVYGNTTKELFRNAARGMFFLISGSSITSGNTRNQRYWKVECQAGDIEDLLFSWLSDLLYIHQSEFVILEDFIIHYLSKKLIQSEAVGIKSSESPYWIEKEIKAVTYHHLQVIKNDLGRWETDIIFDI